MSSPSRSPESCLPLMPALVLLGGLAVIGLLLLFPPLRAPHPEFGRAVWLLLAAGVGFFPLRAGLLSTATRRAPAPLVVRTRRRRSLASHAVLKSSPKPAPSPVVEHTAARLPRGGRRAGRRLLPRTLASS